MANIGLVELSIILLGLLAFFVIPAVVVVFLLARAGGRGRATGAAASLTVLHERYARGEITREQYLQMREDIEGRPPG